MRGDILRKILVSAVSAFVMNQVVPKMRFIGMFSASEVSWLLVVVCMVIFRWE